MGKSNLCLHVPSRAMSTPAGRHQPWPSPSRTRTPSARPRWATTTARSSPACRSARTPYWKQTTAVRAPGLQGVLCAAAHHGVLTCSPSSELVARPRLVELCDPGAMLSDARVRCSVVPGLRCSRAQLLMHLLVVVLESVQPSVARYCSEACCGEPLQQRRVAHQQPGHCAPSTTASIR